MSKAEIGAGDVSITLGGKEYKLKPTLKACTELSKGVGLQGMVQRCFALEMETIVQVITVGLGKSSRDLPQLVYDAGLRNVNATCIKYLTNLANGGRPVDDKEDGDSDNPTEEKQSQSSNTTNNLPDTLSDG